MYCKIVKCHHSKNWYTNNINDIYIIVKNVYIYIMSSNLFIQTDLEVNTTMKSKYDYVKCKNNEQYISCSDIKILTDNEIRYLKIKNLYNVCNKNKIV